MWIVFWTVEDRYSDEPARDHYEIVRTQEAAAFRYDQLVNTKAFLVAAGYAKLKEGTMPHWNEEV